VHFPGPFRGGPLWVDDGAFEIGHHVFEEPVSAPGSDAKLLEAATRVYQRLLDPRRPLWELWFLTGAGNGRIGVLLKLHHAVADGSAAVSVMASLFDVEPDAPDPVTAPWTPKPIPTGWSLLADSLSTRMRAVRDGLAILAHPRRLASAARVFVLVVRRSFGAEGAPGTSLNQVVRTGRRVRFLRLDLEEVRAAGHAHGGKVNDVVLDVWSGGLRRLLLSRGEPVAGVELMASVPVSTRSGGGPQSIDNQTGTVVLPLPIGEADPNRRLDRIVERTRRAKVGMRAAAIMGVLVRLSATPVGRYLNTHQRAVNTIVSNVVGPPEPMYILGARIIDIVPILQLVGNLALVLCAFSYAGTIFVVVTADARGFPDIDVLMEGMEQEWRLLIRSPVAEPIPA
jgi:WS/DGAT/MGAT family acyltransferase